jgi:hypothetical protein
MLSGGWDRQVEKLSNYDIIYSIDKHFNEGKEWRETDFYQRGKEAVQDNRSWEGRGNYNDIEEFEQYLERIDDLYTKINSEGYKTQRELFNLESRSSQFPPRYWRALETNEITVNVGRDGEFIMSDGWHRLSISKALGLDKIPVRIKVRHSKWQEKRRKVAEGQIEPGEHPDLISVKNKS